MNSSLNDNNLVETSHDAQLAKTGLVNPRNNPKLANLGQDMNVSQNHSVFDMTQQVGANKDATHSQILANLDQSQQQAVLDTSQMMSNGLSPVKNDSSVKGQQNDVSLLGVPQSDNNRSNHNGSAVTGNHLTIAPTNPGENLSGSLVEQLQSLNIPQEVLQVDEL